MENRKTEEFTGEELTKLLSEQYETIMMCRNNIGNILAEVEKRKSCEPAKLVKE